MKTILIIAGALSLTGCTDLQQGVPYAGLVLAGLAAGVWGAV